MAREDKLKRCYRQVLSAQLVLTVVAMLITAGFKGVDAVLAALLGAGLAIVNTWLGRRSIEKSSQLAYRSPGRAPGVGMVPVFVGLVQRLVLFTAGLAVGLVWWQLNPLAILGTFMLVQLGYFACKMTAP